MSEREKRVYTYRDDIEMETLINMQIRELDLPGIRFYSDWIRDAVRKQLADGFGRIESVYGVNGQQLAALMTKTREIHAKRALAKEIDLARQGASPPDLAFMERLLRGEG